MRAVPGEDLHDLVLARELELLEALLLELFLGRQVELLLEDLQALFEVDVLLVVALELGLALKQGPDELLVLFLHRSSPARGESWTLICPKMPCQREAGRVSSASGGRT